MNFWKLQTKFLIKHTRSLVLIFVLLVISLIAHRAFLANTLYKGDDFTHHALRTGSYYLALKQGQLPVRWGPNLNQGFGYPSFNYMYHTPYLLGSFFHAAGLSIQQSVNTVILVSALGMSIFSYIFFRIISNSHRLGFLLSLMYSFNPYILLTMYWRGAIGELLFYMGIPLFLLLVYKMLQTPKLIYILCLSVVLEFLILSHLPSLLLLGILTLVFILTQFKTKVSKKSAFYLVITGLLSIALTAWYWLPAILERDLVNYVAAGSLTQYETQFISLLQVFKVFSSNSTSDLFNQVVQIGLPSVFIVITTFYLLYKRSFNNSVRVLFWVGFFTVSVLLTTPMTDFFWSNCKIIPYVQFPWRFLWPAVFATAMLALIIFKSKQVSSKLKLFLYIVLVLTILITAKNYIQTKGTQPRSDFEWFHPTFETGSSFDEHQPVSAQFPYEFESEILYVPNLATVSAQTVKSADDILQNVYITGTKISFEVSHDEGIIVILKRLFYPGWEAYLEENTTEIITNTPNYEGVISVLVPANTQTVTVSFTGTTPIRKIGNYTSLTANFLYFCLLAYYLKNLHTKSRTLKD